MEDGDPARAAAGTTPTAADTAPTTGSTTGWIELGLPYRAPLPLATLIDFLDQRAVPGVERVAGGTYHRTLRLPGGPGIVSLGPADPPARASSPPDPSAPPGTPGAPGTSDAAVATGTPGAPGTPDAPGTSGMVACRLQLADPEDCATAVAACRRLLDLDVDPAAVDGVLGTDPLLAPLVAATPGRRAPGHVDPGELAVRAVLGQQVSLKAARHLAGRLAVLCGDPLPEPVLGLTVGFPAPAAIAEGDLDQLGMPGSRRATVRALARALSDGSISLAPGADPDEAERKLLEIRGIGPWTAAYIRMRALGDPDVLLTTDLGVRHALDRLGVDPASEDLPARWRPWGSYAVQHLWASLAADG